jgi:uncharacterized protein
VTLGFDHSKLRFMYDKPAVKEAVLKMTQEALDSYDSLLIEGARDFSYGASLGIDTLSVAKYTGAKLYVVLSGDSDDLVDDIAFLKNVLTTDDVNFGGFIANQVRDVDEFNEIFRPIIEEMNMPLVSVIPSMADLTHLTMSYIAEKLHAKVISGEGSLEKVVKNVLVGAMSTDETMRNPIFNTEDKFLITSGDRSDMILAALERDTRGIVLTNNILPPANIIAKAREKEVPLLLVTMDTFKVAKQIDRMEALLTSGNEMRIGQLKEIVEKYIDIDEIFS